MNQRIPQRKDSSKDGNNINIDHNRIIFILIDFPVKTAYYCGY